MRDGSTGQLCIGNSAFKDSGLTAVTIPGSVTAIGTGAFRECGSLGTVTLSKGVTSIGNSAFRECGSLTAVTIYEGVAVIGYNAFTSCGSLKGVALPVSLGTIGSGAFSDCDTLKCIWYAGTDSEWAAVTKGDGWNSGTPQDMDMCFVPQETRRLVLPAGLTAIGAGAFAGCDGLRIVRIPDGMTPDALDDTSLPVPLYLTGTAGGAAEQIAAAHPGWLFMAE